MLIESISPPTGPAHHCGGAESVFPKSAARGVGENEASETCGEQAFATLAWHMACVGKNARRC